MKLSSRIVILLALIGAPAFAGQPTYKRWGMFGGYKDKLIAPDRWRVEAGVNGQADEGAAQNIAVYRAAEIVQQAGFGFMQIVNQKGSQTMIGVGYATPTIRGGGSMKLEVIGVNTDAPPSECLVADPQACFTVNVQKTMDAIRPNIRFPEKQL